MAYTPFPITNGIPFVQGANYFGSIHLTTDADYIDMNQRILYGPIIDPQLSLPDSYAGGADKAGQFAYDKSRKSIAWWDGNSWIYPALVNNSGFNVKPPVDLCSGNNSIFSGVKPNGPATIDGIAVTGDGTHAGSMRVLLTYEKGTGAGEHQYNGLWWPNVTPGQDWVRCDDSNEDDEIPGALVVVNARATSGTNEDNTIWLCTTNLNGFTLDTSASTWTKLDLASYIAGVALELVGRTFNVLVDNATVKVNGSNQLYAVGVVKETTITFSGDGTRKTVTYNVGTAFAPSSVKLDSWYLRNAPVTGSYDDRTGLNPDDILIPRYNLYKGATPADDVIELTLSTQNGATYYLHLVGHTI